MNRAKLQSGNVASGEILPSGALRPTACLSRIDEVCRRWTCLQRMTAASLLAAWLAAALVVAGAADAWVRGGHGWRAGLLAILLASVIWVVRRAVMPRWRQMRFHEAALLLETTYPSLNGRLVTAVQLADQTHRADSGVSDGLYDRVCVAAEQAASTLSPATAVPGGPAVKRCLASWLLVIAALAAAGLNPESAFIGIGRVLLPWKHIEWPKRTLIEVTQIDRRVVRGGTLVLAGRANGDVPSTGTLRVRLGQATADRAHFEIANGGDFKVQYRPVTQDLEVWVEIGDNATAPVRVAMVPPPEIISIQAECTYPAFTRLPVQKFEDGNIQAVFGTQVRLAIVSNKPVKDARLTWEDGKSDQMKTDARPGAEANMVVRSSQSYRIHLTDENGFHNADPVIYRIEMTDNQYPQFDQVSPATDRRVTPQAVLPIRAEIDDDYGVAAVILCYRRGSGDEPSRTEVPISRTGKRATVEYGWALEPLKLQPGDTVTYWMEARDEGEHATAQAWPVSRQRKLKVMSEVELAKALSDELEQIMDKLAQLESLQAETAESVKRIAASVGSDRPAALQERARAEKWRQDRLARTTGQLGESLSRVADDYATSRIGQEDRWQRLRATAARLGQLAGTDMPAIVLSLEDALHTLRSGTPAATQPAEVR